MMRFFLGGQFIKQSEIFLFLPFLPFSPPSTFLPSLLPSIFHSFLPLTPPSPLPSFFPSFLPTLSLPSFLSSFLLGGRGVWGSEILHLVWISKSWPDYGMSSWRCWPVSWSRVLSHKYQSWKFKIGSQQLAFSAIWLTDYIPSPLSVETQL